ncbi:YdeI/OmpD-associated family protein [Vibrio genomosp. F10]|uniref:YdeI/OmpD-associated family protein n=1 Tax=Vibrio genomosp. F10 TaxID=723171 RepID=UPI0002D2601B|nr:YdeI/OmpD-associated family protein [Vibrio genomosp. F10]OEF05402.1 bacteriocin-protection protein [Vibrio genomosp. F10 str. 9ZB36]
MDNVIFFKTEEEFQDWLSGHYRQTTEIWVGYFKKNTGRQSISWSESVDAALCFGWIDGIRKTVDQHSYKIRFTPRKFNSVWSAINIQKVDALKSLGKMRPEGLHAFNNRADTQGYSSRQRNVALLQDYKERIKANQSAWSVFTRLAPSYKRDSIWWVMSAKKEETRLRRLRVLIASAEEGLKIPMLRKK